MNRLIAKKSCNNGTETEAKSKTFQCVLEKYEFKPAENVKEVSRFVLESPINEPLKGSENSAGTPSVGFP